MECKDILNLIAIVVIPIVAVVIGQHLQNRAEIRKDRMHIFKVLMTSRIYGWTQDVLADRLGKSRPAIANTLRLLTLQPEVLALIESGKLSAGHARSLVVVSDPATQVKLAKLAVTKKVTVRDLEKAVKQLNNPQAKKVKVEPSPELKELINLMQHKFATKVSVMGNDKKGRIYIDYYSSDDLDRILDFLSK